MTIPTSHTSYIQSGGTATSVQFTFPSPARDPTSYDIAYPLYQGWINTSTKGIWYLESFASSSGVVTAVWRAVAPIVLHATSAPTSADYLYPIGQTWVVETTNAYWVLVDVTGTTATWIQLSAGGGNGIDSITGNSGGAVFGDASNNVNLLGTAGQINVVGTPGTNTLAISLVGGSTAVDSIAVDTISGGGVNPVLPDASGELFFTGSTTTFTTSPAVNTLHTEVQSTTNTILFGQGANTASSATNAVGIGTVLTDAAGIPTFSDAVTSTATGANFAFNTLTSAVTRSVTVSTSDNTSTSSQAAVFTAVGGASAGDAWFSAYISGLSGYSWGLDNSDSDILKETGSNAGPSTGPVLRTMTVAGQQNLPLQSAFSSQLSSSVANATGDGTAYVLICNSEFYDQNSEYNVGTGVFTAKQSGKYLFTVTVSIGNLGAGHTQLTALLTVGTAPTTIYLSQINPGAVRDSSNVVTLTGSAQLPVAVSDTAYVTITVSGGTKTVTINGNASNTPPYCAFSAVMVV